MKNLKNLRENLGLSQQALANELGSTQQKIYSYENGIYEPDIATLKQFANFFNTSADYIIGNTEFRNKIEKVDKFNLNKDESNVIEKYRSLSSKKRNFLHIVLNSLIENDI